MGRKVQGAAIGGLTGCASRAIPARRMARGRTGFIQGAGRNRGSTRRRSPKPAKPIQGFEWRQGLIRLTRRNAHGKGDHAAQHIHEKPGKRQVRPFRLGGHMKQHNPPGTARLRRDQRRAIREPCPATFRQAR